MKTKRPSNANPLLASSTAFFAVMLAGCAASGHKSFDTAADPAEQAKTYVRNDRMESLKGINKVVIPYFQVEFVTKSSAGVYSSSAKTTSSASTSYTLTGVDDALMQAITERLYAKLVADLAAAGIATVPMAEMVALPAYADVQARSKPAPYEVSPSGHTSRFFAPQGMGVYFINLDSEQKRLGLGASMFNTFGNIANKQPEQFEPALQKEAGAGAVLQARYTVDFADLKTHKSSFSGLTSSQSSASVNSTVGIMLQPEATRFSFIVDGYPTVYVGARHLTGTQLKEPVYAADTTWVRDVVEVNKTLNRMGDVAVAVIGAASMLAGGGMMSSSVREYEVSVQADGWATSVEEMAGSTEAMFMSQIKPSL